jgi:hypothetical protein
MKIPIMYFFSGNCSASVPISPIHVSVTVSNLYIPRIGPNISLQQNRQTDLEIYKSLTDILGKELGDRTL